MQNSYQPYQGQKQVQTSHSNPNTILLLIIALLLGGIITLVFYIFTNQNNQRANYPRDPYANIEVTPPTTNPPRAQNISNTQPVEAVAVVEDNTEPLDTPEVVVEAIEAPIVQEVPTPPIAPPVNNVVNWNSISQAELLQYINGDSSYTVVDSVRFVRSEDYTNDGFPDGLFTGSREYPLMNRKNEVSIILVNDKNGGYSLAKYKEANRPTRDLQMPAMNNQVDSLVIGYGIDREQSSVVLFQKLRNQGCTDLDAYVWDQQQNLFYFNQQLTQSDTYAVYCDTPPAM